MLALVYITGLTLYSVTSKEEQKQLTQTIVKYFNKVFNPISYEGYVDIDNV